MKSVIFERMVRLVSDSNIKLTPQCKRLETHGQIINYFPSIEMKTDREINDDRRKINFSFKLRNNDVEWWDNDAVDTWVVKDLNYYGVSVPLYEEWIEV